MGGGTVGVPVVAATEVASAVLPAATSRNTPTRNSSWVATQRRSVSYCSRVTTSLCNRVQVAWAIGPASRLIVPRAWDALRSRASSASAMPNPIACFSVRFKPARTWANWALGLSRKKYRGKWGVSGCTVP